MPATWVATREVSLDDLARFPGNARRGVVKEIRKSILANGQYRAIVVRQGDDALTILAGNHTYDAMRDLASKPPSLDAVLAAVPEDEREAHRETAEALLDMLARRVVRCEIITCTDREARKINLADNRLSDLASDDPDALIEALSYLDGDYEGTGWTDEEVQALIDPPDPPDSGDLDPGEDKYREQYGVIVICSDETEQQAAFEDLQAHGYECKIVTT